MSRASLITATAWLAASLACVDQGGKRPGGMVGPPPPPEATCDVAAPVPYAGSAVIPSSDTSPAGPYRWSNVVIKGGGFVSGIITSRAMQDLVFARTDVGGAYRWDPTNRRWMPITDWAGRNDSNLTGIESIAPDPTDPNKVYIAAGEYLTAGPGFILSSTDMGQTFQRNAISAPMGGNVDGRNMGERLAVDPNLPSTLYFGSRNTGLWKSTDSARTWTQAGFIPPPPGSGIMPTYGVVNGGVGSQTMAGLPAGTGYGLTFVVFDPRSGSPGTASQSIYVGIGSLTEAALYRSTDGGATWQTVAGQPAIGMMPHHAVVDGCGNLYVAYNNGSGPNGVTTGAVWRYNMDTGAWKNVSPPATSGGYGGISADPAHPGTFVVSTIDNWSPGEIFRTTNGGTTWVPLVGQMQRDVSGAQWLYWHTNGLPAMGWMGDVEIDPFNPSRAFYITGQGLWSTDDVTAADARTATHWSFTDDGLEETVVLDLASPPVGAPLLSGVGDIGGFKHDDLGVSPPTGMSSNPIFGNTTSLDFAEGAPNIVARVGTSSNGGARGAFSTDGGVNWTPFPSAPTGSTGSGSVAVSADGNTFVWAPARGTPSYWHWRDPGSTWVASVGITAGARVTADRVNAAKFYANRGNTMYVSTDGGANFTMLASASGRPRAVFGVEGDLWVATNTGLLHSAGPGMPFTPVSAFNGATAVGFGKAADQQTYPAVYVAGSGADSSGIFTWGIYRSDDAGQTWNRIDDPAHQFGFINVLTGDPRQYGRVYLGTGGRGIVYGDPR